MQDNSVWNSSPLNTFLSLRNAQLSIACTTLEHIQVQPTNLAQADPWGYAVLPQVIKPPTVTFTFLLPAIWFPLLAPHPDLKSQLLRQVPKSCDCSEEQKQHTETKLTLPWGTLPWWCWRTLRNGSSTLALPIPSKWPPDPMLRQPPSGRPKSQATRCACLTALLHICHPPHPSILCTEWI